MEKISKTKREYKHSQDYRIEMSLKTHVIPTKGFESLGSLPFN